MEAYCKDNKSLSKGNSHDNCVGMTSCNASKVTVTIARRQNDPGHV